MEKNIKEILLKKYSIDKIESIKIVKNRVIISIIGGEIEASDEELKNQIIDNTSIEKVSIIHTEELKPISSNPFDSKTIIKGVKNIILVASGKGGVGKSTTAVNLALSLANQNLKVALFDGDIYGPSIPTMLGYEGESIQSSDGKILEPFLNMGIKSMSIGAMIDINAPVIWRGIKAVGAIEQLISSTNWGEIDVFVIDMPPGTGDIQLSISQKFNIAGAVIVSTPQDIALIDAIRGVKMFEKVNIPIFGIVENMSYYICEHCGTRANIFGTDGAKQQAKKLGVDFLGAVPLHIDIRENSDSGTPIVFAKPDSEHTKKYEEIAKKIAKKLGY